MSKNLKFWLVIATCLVAVGMIIFAAVMTLNRWDFTKLITVEHEKNTYEISDEFSNIAIKTDTADIAFVPSDDGKCKVICDEQENIKHSVTVKDGTLTIEIDDTRKWYDHIGINFGGSSITVYLPNAEYGALSAKASTGDIRVKNLSADALDLSVSTGDVTVADVKCEGDVKVKVSTGDTKLTNITCQNVISSGSTGGISLKNVIVAEKLSIERSTGDVKLEKCDADEIFIKTDTGDVTGTLLSEKDFVTKSDTGDIEVPESVTGGRCEITTDTGDIKIKIQR